VEADESDRSFLQLSPEIAIVTNVELDHHTTYGSTVELEGAFRAFLERLPEAGAAVVWDRPALRRLVPAGRRVATYDLEDDDNRVGGGPAPELAAHAVRATGARMRFELLRGGESVCDVELPVAGRHNVLNALAALTAVELAGFDLERAARSLVGFRPAARRFEPKGSGGGIAVYDDYAHHPSEIAATLDAARALEPARLLAVFQPHLYSRTLHLHRELGRELARADVAIVLDVYAARELPDGPFAGVSGKLVADACAEHAAGRPVWWLPTQDEAETALVHQMRAGDVIVTLGAGDVDRLAERLAARLDGTPAR
jgi:UDP-N-acetylmuramate--alanine ligase